MSMRVFTEADIDQMLNAVLRGSGKYTPDEAGWLYPEGAFSFNGPGGDDEPAIFNCGRGLLLEMQPQALRACEVLARRLRDKLAFSEAEDEHMIEVEIASAIGTVVSGTRKMKGLGRDLLKDLADRMGALHS